MYLHVRMCVYVCKHARASVYACVCVSFDELLCVRGHEFVRENTSKCAVVRENTSKCAVEGGKRVCVCACVECACKRESTHQTLEPVR